MTVRRRESTLICSMGTCLRLRQWERRYSVVSDPWSSHFSDPTLLSPLLSVPFLFQTSGFSFSQPSRLDCDWCWKDGDVDDEMNFNWRDFLIFKLVNVLFLDTTHLNNTDTALFLKGCSILAIWTWSSLSCEIIVTSIWLEYARDRVPDPFCQRLYSNGVYCLSGLGLLFCRVIPPCICPGRQMRLFTIISCHATYAFYLKSLFGVIILMEIL